MFGRKIAQQTRKRQAMFELGRTGVHLRRAAAHLVVGTAESLTPTYDRAMLVVGRGWDSTHGTTKHLSRQMRQGAAESRAMRQLRNARRRGELKLGPKRGRWKGLSRLLIAGAAVGAASAVVARRRRTWESDEYEPMTGFDDSHYAEGHDGARTAALSGMPAKPGTTPGPAM